MQATKKLCSTKEKAPKLLNLGAFLLLTLVGQALVATEILLVAESFALMDSQL